MDEEELVIDSPELSPVEDEDLEDLDHIEDGPKLGQPASMLPKAGNTHFHKDKDGDRKQVCNCLHTHGPRNRLLRFHVQFFCHLS